MTRQHVKLRENSTLECGTVDESRPVIPGVKLLGEESKNRRRYLPESVSPSQYERVPVYLNHPDGKSDRRVQDKFGWIEKAIKEGADWRGDLHYNPEHPYAKQFAWLAKNNPSQIGLSHDAVGQGRTENGIFIVEKVVQVKSVDLVANPATTQGLFESMEPDTSLPPEEKLDDLETHIKNAVGAICTDDKLTSAEKAKKIKAALKLLEEPESEVEEEDDDKEDDEEAMESIKSALALPTPRKQWNGLKKVRESLKSKGRARAKARKSKIGESAKDLAAKNKGLLERFDTLEAKDRLREKNDLAARLCQEAKLPSVAMTPKFLETLVEAKDEKAMRELIADRKALASIQKPTSTGPLSESQAANLDNKQFAKQLKG